MGGEEDLLDIQVGVCFILKHLGHILLVPSVFGRLSSVFGRLQNPVLWDCLPKTVGLEGLQNLLLS